MMEMRIKILEAAVRVFMRYGVGRTRMGDIATEAGVVRQTLYSFFKSKNEILAASIRHYSEVSLDKIQKEWDTCDGISEKLDVYFEHAIIASYQMISATPDARDMIGGFNAHGMAETERAQANKIDVWEIELSEHAMSKRHRALKKKQLSEFIVLSSIGLRDQAKSEKQLRSLLAIQKRCILDLIA